MSYSSSNSIVINAPKEAVWDALTNPAAVKEYFFGTDLVTDWTVGSPIYFRGEWQGKSYEDKGIVLEYTPEETLSYTYWSSMGGTEDAPENYQTLRYSLEDEGEGVKVTIDQSDVATQESADHSSENWKGVLEGLKKYVENKVG
ncbi:MAG: SRPBCC family protein [Candidatus Paceibacterota bacterium]